MKTILLIEDEDAIRDNWVRILEINGFRAIGASHGRDGIQQALVVQPDLILCDISMPDCDGYEVLNTLRSHPVTAAIPFIFLSARTSHAEVRYGMNQGADDYLTKPCSSQDLLAAIHSCFRKKSVFAQGYLEQVAQANAAFEKVANWDSVTNLPNINLFQRHLAQLCDVALQHTESIAVLSLKITSYRVIQLTYGGLISNRLLHAIGERLQTSGRPGITARLHEDEFGLALPDAGDPEEIEEFIQLLINILTVPYHVDGQEIRIQLSVGISLYPQHSLSSEDLLTQSSAAMRWAKKRHSSYRFYSPRLAAVESEHHLIANELAKAIERSELRLYYQPQVDLAKGCIIGAEALVRWQHPERGMIPPNQFITIAEEQGLILELGEWVLRQACHHAAQWQRQGGQPVQVSVNLSMAQFQQASLPELVASILQESGLSPHLLVLELTESCLMDQVELTIQKLQQLKNLGINIAIDDFGTGYSSLSYLSQLPIDEIKIDQSFTHKINRDRNATMICKAIIAMSRSLNLKIIAEGIENSSQLSFLRHQRCHAGQGFLYAPPLSLEAFQIRLQEASSPTLVSNGFLPYDPVSCNYSSN
ncbi:EAL domain-containing protein [Alkalinema pantanalense CENA528]|uniref:EAL domain-containing response regulator n=1 Tax=Alkalinema pantanalense TaxID=1620705 RepID=UPI003D6F7489